MLNKTNTKQVKFYANGEGDSFKMMGIQLFPKVTGEDNDGAFSLVDQIVQPGAGSPPHILLEGDKVLYVLEGEFTILLGEEAVQARAGACALIPRGTVHSFRNTGAGQGRIIAVVSPAGHEKFLYDLSQYAKDGPPAREVMAEVAEKHNVQILAPKK